MQKTQQLHSLLPYCAPAQGRAVTAIIEHGSSRKAAAALGLNERTVTAIVAAVRKKAARSGYAPENDMTHPAAPGYAVKGTSTLYDADGQVKAQWVKTREDSESLEHLREALADLAEPFRGIAKATSGPKRTDAETMTVYPIGDAHVGMYAYAAEAGSDFDLSVAEADLCAAVDRLVAVAPASETALVVNVGDFFHSDTSDNRTLQSGHALDVDTRWSKVLQVGIRALRRCIESALRKHRLVKVVNAAGNHDKHTSAVLSAVLDAFYDKEPRVTVDMSPSAFRYHQFGRVLIGVAHGDKTKPEALGPIMAADMPEAWGQTRHRYWLTGHVHHRRAFELPGCLVESFRTLAARDAWHAENGYRSGRDMHCIVLHHEHGEIERHRVDIGMLRAA